MQHDTETLPGGTRVWTTPRHRFGTDALLLADFAPVRPGWSCCDFGSGSGILLLRLVDRGLLGRAVGVELQKEGAALLEGAAAEQGLRNVEAVQGDLRAFTAAKPFDLVVANPPYFSSGAVSPEEGRSTARHALHGGLTDFCGAARRVLKDRGRFCVCWPATGLAGLFTGLAAAGLAPKRLQLVRKNSGDAPWLALVEARKACGEGMDILPDRILPPGQPVFY